MKDSIIKALEIFRRFPDASHRETVEHLTPLVGDSDLAQRLVEFVPIAFARIALADSGIKFQNSFCRALGNRKFTHECPLSSEPLYEPALAIAREEQAKDISEADRLAVLSRDATFNMVNEAIAAGQDMRGAVTAPTIFLRNAPMPCEPKPWWRFW